MICRSPETLRTICAVSRLPSWSKSPWRAASGPKAAMRAKVAIKDDSRLQPSSYVDKRWSANALEPGPCLRLDPVMSDTAPDRVTCAVLIIGDEILSGRTQDTNLRDIARYLGVIGVDL